MTLWGGCSSRGKPCRCRAGTPHQRALTAQGRHPCLPVRYMALCWDICPQTWRLPIMPRGSSMSFSLLQRILVGGGRRSCQDTTRHEHHTDHVVQISRTTAATQRTPYATCISRAPHSMRQGGLAYRRCHTPGAGPTHAYHIIPRVTCCKSQTTVETYHIGRKLADYKYNCPSPRRAAASLGHTAWPSLTTAHKSSSGPNSGQGRSAPGGVGRLLRFTDRGLPL